MRASLQHLVGWAALAVSALVCTAPAQAELTLDPGFGTNGVTWTMFGSNSDEPRDLLIQPGGKILTAGLSWGSSGETYIAISRHSAAGVPDSSFGVDGQVRTRFEFRDQANAIALQEDGKIVAVGMQMTSTGVSSQRATVYRFLADGTVDTSFGDGGYVWHWGDYETGEYNGVKVLADGNILAGGRRSPGYWGGFRAFAVRRYLPDGTQTVGGGLLEYELYSAGSCAFPEAGGILFASIAWVNGSLEYVMARVDSAGNADAGFGGDGVVELGIPAVIWCNPRVQLLPDGKILLFLTTDVGGGDWNWTVLQFLSDGTPDDLFGTNGRTDVSFGSGGDQCLGAAVDGSGRILLAGQGNGQPALARLLPDGSLDSTFSDDGKFTIDLNGGAGTHYFTRILVLPDGRILAAGCDYSSNGGDFFLAVFLAPDATGVDGTGTEPSQLAIRAFPNPSRGETTIQMQLSRSQPVRVEIFDLTGRAVRRVFAGSLAAGTQAFVWDGRDDDGSETPTGVYLTRVSSSEGTWTAKLLQMR